MLESAAVRALLLSLAAGLSTLLGALVVFAARRRSEKLLAVSLGFAGGVMLAVSFTDLFPTAREHLTASLGGRPGALAAVLSLAAGIGCAAALCEGLRALGRTAWICPHTEETHLFTPYLEGRLAPEGYVPETVVSVDIAARSLFTRAGEPWLARGVDLAIDHHPSQEFFARETCLEADSAACGEIVYDILRQLTPLTPEMALPLYVAISTDTGCFVYSNTTPRSHRIAAQLMDCGIDVAPVNKALFRTKSAVRLAMEARMVAGMERCDAGRVVVMQIPLSLRQELHATDADIEELSALAAQVEGTDCGVTLRELRPGTVKLSLRTGPRVNATEVCRLLGGGGHAAAAGATVSGTMAQAKSAVLAAIAQVIGPLAP